MLAADTLSSGSTTSAELAAIIESLLEQGADSFDPIRFRYIESMIKRASEQRKLVAQIIEKKARKALDDYQNDFLVKSKTEQNNAIKRVEKPQKQDVEISEVRADLVALTQYLDQGKSHDDKGISEGSFTNVLRQQESDVVQSFAGTATGQKREPNAIRLYRESWIKQNSDRLVMQSVKNGPEDPGPLNSQMLVIQSLSTMRGLSPDYLNRFVSYVDTLLWLEQASNAKSKGVGKKPGRSKK